MAREERSKEAPIHFELYRLIKDLMTECQSATLRYISVEPEYAVGSGTVDLVVNVKKENEITHFLGIEVKKPTLRSYLLYDLKSEQQAERYAKNLQSPYFALTDGHVLRLFNPNGRIGNYRIQLTDDHVRHLLIEMLELGEGKRQALGFQTAPSPEEFPKDLDKLASTLTDVFKQLEQEEGFALKPKEHERTHELQLSFGPFKKVLSLTLQREKRDRSKDTSYVLLGLSDLRKIVGKEALYELLAKLSQIPCFQWINPNNANDERKFTWKNLRDIPVNDDLQLEGLKESLVEWFSDLSKRPDLIKEESNKEKDMWVTSPPSIVTE
jgi:hypothetical protein